MKRRTFLKIAGMGSLSFAAGCTSEPEKTLYALVEAPDDMVTGKTRWYASTCRECPAGCGILAKNREGRVIKVEGNPHHPINRGKLCMRGQAALQGVYNPDRITTPLLREKEGWRPLSFQAAEALLKDRAAKAARNGQDRVRMVTEVVGGSLMGLFAQSLERWKSGNPLVFEPYAYESLKTANQKVFGINGLISYHMEEADFLVSFGADFLETWLSPVAYAWKFKQMHSLKQGRKGLFFHVSPYQSLTCANADLWISCMPGGEAAVALGLLREAVSLGRTEYLPEEIRDSVEDAAASYTREKVIQISGVSPEFYDKLKAHLFQATKPLVLGTGSGGSGISAVQTDVAVNLLNVVLDPEFTLLDFNNRHRVEIAARRSQVLESFKTLEEGAVDLLLLNNVNPVYALPLANGKKAVLEKHSGFIVSFSNFMDETTALADLILPVALPLETWDEYGGIQDMLSTLQPAMGSLTGAPVLGDVFLRTAFGKGQVPTNYKAYLYKQLIDQGRIRGQKGWIQAFQKGGIFETSSRRKSLSKSDVSDALTTIPSPAQRPIESELTLIAAPSIRFFDGRGANKPWLCEVPDPLSKVSWQTPVLMHPETLAQRGLEQEDIVQIETKWGRAEAPIYETKGVRPGLLIMGIGQGHETYGRYAQQMGANPYALLPSAVEPLSGGPFMRVAPVSIRKTGRSTKLAHTDGSRIPHGRKIALAINLKELDHGRPHKKGGLSMEEFPLTLPLPEGYETERDIYPVHEHKAYRWAMVVDLDRCIGCGACATACYAENSLGVVGLERVLEGREMSWLEVQRYHDPERMERMIFLPMLCQHCDNAPCESVCPVYAPHHSEEGLNNQIYNRCIGTRFCSQNCPYKVRRFNWFSWTWPEPLNLQLNPDVTVRSKGVMEKCSFCIQRIKEAHGMAKDEKRKIMDGEIQPACLQTCPTGVFTFGNLVDKQSQVRKMVEDRRAYQVMGYLNTKPAVIYLKKVVQEI
ncbi:MAG: 4Fe-4S dicluster domain-containing protein [Desulfobacteraceae bacterium]|jgi:molybdopterin-containing oxidoreductase family iron-sulfur binding subunit